MMLTQSSLCSSIADGLTSVSGHGQQEFSCGWIHGDLTWQEPTPIYERKNKDDNSCSWNFLSSSQPSTNDNMPEMSTPNFVYKRRKIQRNSSSVPPLSQSSTPTFVYKRRKVQKKPAAVFDLPSKLGSIDGALTRLEPMVEENPKRKMRKTLELCAINGNYSSSKSNMDLSSASMKLQVDDVGECSSSEKNPCISFLRRHGVLERLLSSSAMTRRSEKVMDVRNNICCLRLCKVCNQSDTTLKMLICDLCEESCHESCCYPYTKEMPIDEWLCDSCLRKKRKKLKEKNLRNSIKDNSGPIVSMLRGAGPYMSNVRIGKKFQAKVPDWSGPIINDLNNYGEPVDISPLECGSYQDSNASELSRLGSIGNWLQCRAVIDDDGTICGKWRRAPLFEVQTDDWECFRSVLWDPTLADCAVPQEVDTDQVRKQLKYIEMLRPRLPAKRCKSGVNKRANSQ